MEKTYQKTFLAGWGDMVLFFTINGPKGEGIFHNYLT